MDVAEQTAETEPQVDQDAAEPNKPEQAPAEAEAQPQAEVPADPLTAALAERDDLMNRLQRLGRRVQLQGAGGRAIRSASSVSLQSPLA